MLDAAGVLADDLLADVVEGAEDRLRAAVDAALADARDATASVSTTQKTKLRLLTADSERLKAGDLHGVPLLTEH